MRFVVDASVVLKWWRTEINSAEAGLLRDRAVQLRAPDFLPIELASVVTQWVRQGRTAETDADLSMAAISLLPIELYPCGPLIAKAHDLAVRIHPSLYDCLYVALALEMRRPLVTADRRLYEHVHAVHPEAVIWIADMPLHLGTR